MNRLLPLTVLASCLWAASTVSALAGPLDPDCTPQKAAKGAAAKSTVGVGGRCSAGEAAKDSAKRSAGVEKKGPVEKRRDDDGPKDAIKKIKD